MLLIKQIFKTCHNPERLLHKKEEKIVKRQKLLTYNITLKELNVYHLIAK